MQPLMQRWIRSGSLIPDIPVYLVFRWFPSSSFAVIVTVFESGILYVMAYSVCKNKLKGIDSLWIDVRYLQ